jgi:hypothetical protein
MSTLSHNIGKERTHDPDQNTPQTLCPQRNREAQLNTRPLAQNPHSVRTLARLKIKIINRFLSLDNPVKTHCRSNPDITLKSEVRRNGTSRDSTAKQLCPNSTVVRRHAHALRPVPKSRTKPKKIHKFKPTGKSPKHRSIVIVL